MTNANNLPLVVDLIRSKARLTRARKSPYLLDMNNNRGEMTRWIDGLLEAERFLALMVQESDREKRFGYAEAAMAVIQGQRRALELRLQYEGGDFGEICGIYGPETAHDGGIPINIHQRHTGSRPQERDAVLLSEKRASHRKTITDIFGRRA